MTGDDEMRRLFERVMDAMIRNRWLESYRFTEGKGFHLVWSERGGETAQALKDIVVTYDLLHGDDAPYLFYVACHGTALSGFHCRPEDLDPSLTEFFKGAAHSLGIYGSKEDLRTLVHIVDGWA